MMKHQAVLLDLGGVVLDIDVGRVFKHWAAAGNVPVKSLIDRWRLDKAYEEHERGERDFRGYANHLGERLALDLPLRTWREGWNELFVGVYPEVFRLMQEIGRHRPLFAFTNTNATHEHAWRSRYPELDIFEHVFVSSRIGRRKPELHAYEYVTSRIGIDPSDILFLDDNRENIAGAREAGLDAKLVRSEAQVAAELRKALGIHV